MLPNIATLIPTTSSIFVSWIAPQFFNPANYSVSVSCMQLCNNTNISTNVLMVSGGATSNTITGLSPGNNCTVTVTAVFASSGISESNKVNTNTISEGMYSAVDTHSLPFSL